MVSAGEKELNQSELVVWQKKKHGQNKYRLEKHTWRVIYQHNPYVLITNIIIILWKMLSQTFSDTELIINHSFSS